MPKYCDLIAGKGFLEGVDGDINETRKAECEAEAAQRIDLEFAAYDRSWWVPKAQPPAITSIALKLAAAEYIQRSFQSASQSVEIPASVTSLRDRAEKEIATAKGNGWLVGIDGQKVYPAGGKTSSMFVELGVELEDDGLAGRSTGSFPGLGPRGPY